MAYDFHWKNNGAIKLCIIVGTRPEIIRLSATIRRCREFFDCCVAHTGQNYDANLNDVFWADFDIGGPDVYLNVVGENLGQTCGNVIARSYELLDEIRPDALLVLGDTNSCLSAISAKRLHIPIFHMEAGNRCNPAPPCGSHALRYRSVDDRDGPGCRQQRLRPAQQLYSPAQFCGSCPEQDGLHVEGAGCSVGAQGWHRHESGGRPGSGGQEAEPLPLFPVSLSRPLAVARAH